MILLADVITGARLKPFQTIFLSIFSCVARAIFGFDGHRSFHFQGKSPDLNACLYSLLAFFNNGPLRRWGLG